MAGRLTTDERRSTRWRRRRCSTGFGTRAPSQARVEPRATVVSGSSSTAGGLLIEAEDVAGGIAESGGDFGSVDANGLNDLAALGFDLLHGRGGVIDHDVN